MGYYTYILASKKDGVLYIGITCNLKKRVWEHKHKVVEGFSSKYWCHRLVYYEEYGNVNEAICREKRLKKWKRDWKIKLFEDKIQIGKTCIANYRLSFLARPGIFKQCYITRFLLSQE